MMNLRRQKPRLLAAVAAVAFLLLLYIFGTSETSPASQTPATGQSSAYISQQKSKDAKTFLEAAKLQEGSRDSDALLNAMVEQQSKDASIHSTIINENLIKSTETLRAAATEPPGFLEAPRFEIESAISNHTEHPSRFPYGEYSFENQHPFYSEMKQSLPNDLVKPTEKYFVMLKEGSTSIWSRVPMHLLTTFSKVKHFGLYSDIETSLGGYPVHDILKNSTKVLMEDAAFNDYRLMNQWHRNHVYIDVATHDLPRNTFKDGWNTDRFKNLPMLAHAWKNTPSTTEWYIFMDGDTFIFWDNMAYFLSAYDPDEPHYFGSETGYLFFAHGGSGVVVSRAAMTALFGKDHHDEAVINAVVHSYEEATLKTCCGDLMLGSALRDKDISITHTNRIQGEVLAGIRFKKDSWCDPIVTFHQCTTWDIEQMWEYERAFNLKHNKGINPLDKNYRPILHKDLYHDFVLPFVNGSQVRGWDNLIEHIKMSSTTDESTVVSYKADPNYSSYENWDDFAHRPWSSADDCEALCKSWSECVSWRWMSRIKTDFETLPETECAIAPYLRFGFPSEVHNFGNEVISGTRPERLQANRQQFECDPLSQTTLEAADNTLLEGWFWRQ
ncbi:hypothetical protein NADFUDRAFT_51316 [Nadsonia fulvescens var. elongata DSM 6958]|uniref:Glycosyltransferase family 31 protein n=1 Tax=Nadsonia fulvescens var. elongata DSM 6958 TaxID=857566 RepID=A0A1E3PLH4_9ASCO|nr:hypothetical protein NADFUDRAFT_51316 [Nadsonia fulvescens var. elongata DSM 6958]